MSEDEIEEVRFELEHKSAEVAELRAIIRRLSGDSSGVPGVDPMDPDEPCPHTYILIAGEDGARCMMCEASLTVSFDARR